uniref:Galectin n=1 Tax=Cyprinus carpio TaxID=7962 RepID=A0A8C1UTI4_CYPCA
KVLGFDDTNLMRCLEWKSFTQILPFSCPIQGGLLEGMSITVCGRVLPEACRFEVDLYHESDFVLHLNPRYDEGSGYVVHNTYQNTVWGKEETKSQTPFPRGQLFALQILVTLIINGLSIKNNVDRVYVKGMVELNLVAFQYLAVRKKYIHFRSLPILRYDIFLLIFMNIKKKKKKKKRYKIVIPLIHNQTVPYKSIIRGGVQPGKLFIIQGVILDNRMEIFLRHKTGIAFYYSPRFEENVVVCNSYEDGMWGEQEQSELVLFKRGEPMQVTIYSSRLHYRVFVNGQQTQTYSHRYMKLEEIDVLEVSGDAQLSFVQA